MNRVFISYRHGSTEDEDIAKKLHAGLAAAGSEVFIDTRITGGSDWAKEIEQRIRWCTVMIVLLSKEALDSEGLQAEVRLAHALRKVSGSPRILPIRLRYFKRLNYGLDIYIGPLQHVRWDGTSDLLEDVVAALAHADPVATVPQTNSPPIVLDREQGGSRLSLRRDNVRLQETTFGKSLWRYTRRFCKIAVAVLQLGIASCLVLLKALGEFLISRPMRIIVGGVVLLVVVAIVADLLESHSVKEGAQSAAPMLQN
jgi:hypothetical protein